MAVRPIVTIPNPVLTQPCEKVFVQDGVLDEETKSLIQDLLDTLEHAKHPEGAGISANQIGVSKRVCVVRNYIPDPTNQRRQLIQSFVLINPKIVSASKETTIDWEACLSVPNTFGKVERFKKVKVKAINDVGEQIRLTATGYFALVIQHELNHLDGILFTTKVIGKTMTEEELDKLYERQ